MAKRKKDATSIIEPTEAELSLYQQVIVDLTEEQLDEFANEYFEQVQAEKTKSSFPRFVVDKIIRPVKPGDTIQFMDEDNNVNFLFCLIRKEIEGKTYLLFSMVNNETETLMPDQVYLFFVDGYDENGIEMLDIFPAGEEGERILDIMEGEENVQMAEMAVKEAGLPVREEEENNSNS
jgi:hypothetical protein